ncbi:MAG: hypothetical protein LBH04_02890 [Tannerellaceae bacterium]|nr:hypothetical protein [Tannerellaceae bacterium]
MLKKEQLRLTVAAQSVLRECVTVAVVGNKNMQTKSFAGNIRPNTWNATSRQCRQSYVAGTIIQVWRRASCLF